MLTIPLQDSRTMPLKSSVAQLSVSEAKVADVKVLSAAQLLIMAKSLGKTRITMVDGNGRVSHYLVHVILPVAELVERLQLILPRQNIQVNTLGNAVVLTGQVDNVVLSERAQKVVAGYLATLGQDSKVLNFLAVRGQQQVQLRVKMAEVSRSALRQVGFNGWYRGAANAGGLLAPGTALGPNLAPDLGSNGNTLSPGGGINRSGLSAVPSVPMINPPFATGAFGLLFSTQESASFPLSIALNLLLGKGLAKVISEPTLVAFSGQPAEFLSGGEFPVPVPQGLGQTGIEFKKFGVQLTFTPTVLGDSQIRLEVNVAVRDRDQSAGVQIQGTTVPGLATRSSTTTVQLKNGQSFAIAGLLQDRMESTSNKVPLLGDLPLLGMLFRQQSFRRVESELIICVSADLVHPLNRGEVPPLPGEDELSDPGSLRFFLLGMTEGRGRAFEGRGPAGPTGFLQ
jgi:pilus assembly protein CpaC